MILCKIQISIRRWSFYTLVFHSTKQEQIQMFSFYHKNSYLETIFKILKMTIERSSDGCLFRDISWRSSSGIWLSSCDWPVMWFLAPLISAIKFPTVCVSSIWTPVLPVHIHLWFPTVMIHIHQCIANSQIFLIPHYRQRKRFYYSGIYRTLW